MGERKTVTLTHEAESHRWCRQLAGMMIRARKARGWSQSALGTQLGLSQSLVNAMEHDHDAITVKRLYATLLALDLELVVRPRAATPCAEREHG